MRGLLILLILSLCCACGSDHAAVDAGIDCASARQLLRDLEASPQTCEVDEDCEMIGIERWDCNCGYETARIMSKSVVSANRATLELAVSATCNPQMLCDGFLGKATVSCVDGVCGSRTELVPCNLPPEEPDADLADADVDAQPE